MQNYTKPLMVDSPCYVHQPKIITCECTGYPAVTRRQPASFRQLTLGMKLTAIILFIACMTATASGYTQILSIKKTNASLKEVFKEIENQTAYKFFFNERLLKNTKKVTVDLKNAPLEQVLEACFKGQPVTYMIVDKTIVVKRTDPSVSVTSNLPAAGEPPIAIDITGKITDREEAPLAGANVKVKGSDKGTTTNSDGVFILKGVDPNATLEISFIGYQTITIPVNNKTSVIASLKLNVVANQEVIVRKGYYAESRATTTGNVSSISAKDIEKQPVGNVLLAMQALVPGVIINQATGIPGSGVVVQIRGLNSLAKGNEALYIIDGVPYPALNLIGIDYGLLGISLNSSGSGLGIGGYGQSGSPLSYINPADVESIDVLKDADATAIYGSRGANGVIIITTKKGKPGKTKVTVNFQTGIGQVAKRLDVLNTRQYLDTRYEAFKNDGALPNPNLDYDLTLWDTTRQTDWQKVLIGNTAHYNDVQAGISGGTPNTQFIFGVGYHKETSVVLGNYSDQKGSAHININNLSPNKKFGFQVSGSYTLDDNNPPGTDPTGAAIRLEPNAPPMYNPDGSVNWAPDANGKSTWLTNPASHLENTFTSHNNNLISNVSLSYRAFPDLEFKSSFGYNNIRTDEMLKVPLTGFNPNIWNTVQRYTTFSTSQVQSWIVEPQASYDKRVLKGQLNLLLGGTIQHSTTNQTVLDAKGFSSDAVMENIASATSITPGSTLNSLFKYAAAFGRLNYNWKDKYLMNLTGRRDGTSRFGPAKRFHNFGSVGLGWVFSKEKLFQNLSWLSFGKIRGSYGTTGSDQVGDYTYMDLYSLGSYGVPYQGGQTSGPLRIYTPDLEWEETRKAEGGIELGFFHDRVVLKGSYYRNRSSNQLIEFPLAAITGFTTVQRNLPALVQNKGFEFELRTLNIDRKKIQWSSFFHLSINRNKLLSVPEGLSSYYEKMVGHSMISQLVFKYLGVNVITGKYEVADAHGAPTNRPNSLTDDYFLNIETKFYGGFQNSISYKTFQLDFLIQFVDRPLGSLYLYNYLPGYFNSYSGSNQPVTVLNRWQQPGDVKPIQKFSQNGSLVIPYVNASASDQLFGDASYIRLKNASLSWSLPRLWKEKLGLQNGRLYVQGQNLLTLTRYEGLDPETMSAGTMPPLRTITVGIQLTL
jgi:TonB-dependent starch-binding outer membrane protein SusC